jgi:histidinol-phosphate aminotransferase
MLLSSLHSLKELGLGRAIGAQDANFILIPVLARGGSVADSTRAQRVYLTLAEEEGVVVRYRGCEIGCQGCLRITVGPGTGEENAVALEKLRKTFGELVAWHHRSSTCISHCRYRGLIQSLCRL